MQHHILFQIVKFCNLVLFVAILLLIDSIVFLDGPEFSDNSTEVEECIGDNVQLICNAVGRPIPIVKLFLNGNQVKSDSGNLSYNIPQLAKDQFGKYACVANNTVKSVNITMEIKKKRKFLWEENNCRPFASV